MSESKAKREEELFIQVEQKIHPQSIKISRETSSIFLATSFSMVIFLLSFTQEKNLVFDIGIFFLFICIFSQLELYLSMSRVEVFTETSEDLSLFRNNNIKLDLFSNIGIYMFFLGLIYLVSYFGLDFLLIIIIIYVCARILINNIIDVRTLFTLKDKEFTEEIHNLCKVILIIRTITRLSLLLIIITFIILVFNI